MIWKDPKIEIIRSEEQLSDLSQYISSSNYVSLDIETFGKTKEDGLNPLKSIILGIGLTVDGNLAWYIPINHRKPEGLDFSYLYDKNEYDFLPEIKIRQFLCRYLPNKYIIAHNLKFDYKFLKYHYGLELTKFFDTMIGWGIIDDRNIANYNMGLKDILSQLFVGKDFKKWKDFKGSLQEVPVAEAAEYCCIDAIGTYRLFQYLKPQ